jgi:hypothetical protein
MQSRMVSPFCWGEGRRKGCLSVQGIWFCKRKIPKMGYTTMSLCLVTLLNCTLHHGSDEISRPRKTRTKWVTHGIEKGGSSGMAVTRSREGQVGSSGDSWRIATKLQSEKSRSPVLLDSGWLQMIVKCLYFQKLKQRMFSVYTQRNGVCGDR